MERVAIIGGGPAGLAAAQALAQHGIDFVLFEAGPPLQHRKHDFAAQLGCGIGGAGLFSDGKFSFFPSGTHLYTLEDNTLLHSAYTAIQSQLARAGIAAPDLAHDTTSNFSQTGQAMLTKDYPSTYGSLSQRNALIAAMSEGFSRFIFTNTRVETIFATPESYVLHSRTADGSLNTDTFSHLIIATGRFGPKALHAMTAFPVPMTELRYEFGIRIEHKNDVGFLNALKRPDVKYILEAMDTEVRTFCTCRNGEVWMIPYEGVAALSGRSDGPASGYSNFGLLARFTGENRDKGRQIWADLQQHLGQNVPATWQPLSEFLERPAKMTHFDMQARPWFPQQQFRRGDIATLLPPELYRILATSARMLIQQFPDLATPQTVCLFPAVEGTGAFPTIDAGLRDHSGHIWYCGDVVGRFRGLIPALVSGNYAATSLAVALGKNSAARAPYPAVVAAQ